VVPTVLKAMGWSATGAPALVSSAVATTVDVLVFPVGCAVDSVSVGVVCAAARRIPGSATSRHAASTAALWMGLAPKGRRARAMACARRGDSAGWECAAARGRCGGAPGDLRVEECGCESSSGGPGMHACNSAGREYQRQQLPGRGSAEAGCQDPAPCHQWR